MNHDSSAEWVADTLAPEIEALPPGARVPSHRSLIARFEVSATTMSQSLAILARAGLVVIRPGAGTFRSTETFMATPAGDTTWQDAALGSASGLTGPGSTEPSWGATGLLSTLTPGTSDVIDLNGGYLHPELQPMKLLASAVSGTARRSVTWERPPPGGVPELRDWFAEEVGGGVTRQDVAICGGGQSGISTALRALTHPGDPVIIETPTYPGIIAALGAAGVRQVPLPLDEDGLQIDLLDETLGRTSARLILTQPLFHNPTGTTQPQERRDALRAVARRHGAFILEDDFARYLAHGDVGALPVPMARDDPDGTVIHLRSLTKSTSPGLRVAALIARGPVMQRLRSALLVDSLMVATPLQYAALSMVQSTGWRRHLDQLGRGLQQRRDAALLALRDEGVEGLVSSVPRGGFHLWVALPAGLEGEQVAASALVGGVAVTPGVHYRSDGDGSHVRLSYVAATSAADVSAGVRRLAVTVAESQDAAHS